jgi:hypothetical protein
MVVMTATICLERKSIAATLLCRVVMVMGCVIVVVVMMVVAEDDR